MELIVVIVLLVFMGIREWMYYTHIKDLELKAFAKDPKDYALLKNIEEPEELQKEEEEILVDPFEVNPQDALKGIERKE